MAYSFQPCKYTKKKLIVVIEFSFLNENKLFLEHKKKSIQRKRKGERYGKEECT